MLHIFHFLQSDMVWGIVNPFSWLLNTISSEKKCLIFMPFLLTCIDVRRVKKNPFHSDFFSFALQCNLTWMRGNFGLFCSFNQNCLASTLDYIVMQMRKTNREKGYFPPAGSWMVNSNFRRASRTARFVLRLFPSIALRIPTAHNCTRD